MHATSFTFFSSRLVNPDEDGLISVLQELVKDEISITFIWVVVMDDSIKAADIPLSVIEVQKKLSSLAT